MSHTYAPPSPLSPSQVLVKGQPNVSYICSRYYRAPELMFGATEYTCAVDMWSIGTILVELLLGHLPFQGQDSTQQHLVEIMKLLGTPSEKELRVMRATCSVDELPKLKAYPWERVFPSGTPQRAMDLAYKLLSYDPTQRLTASQALHHPFFQGVEYLLKGQRIPVELDVPKAWQQQLHALFDEYVAVRNGAMLGLLPTLESAILQVIPHDGVQEGTERLVLAEIESVLKECERSEQNAFQELYRKVVRAATTNSMPPTSSSVATQLASLQESLATLHQIGPDIDKAAKQTQEAREETASMRAELEVLHAQLAERGAASLAAGSGTADTGIQTEISRSETTEAHKGGVAAAPSSGRRARGHGDVALGAASPVVARQSLVDHADSDSSNPRPRSRMQMASLGEDEMGQVTPLGVGHSTEREHDG
mmetsp:Transcript_79843/g.158666  ORF Transcript_79843/g.158666 Transcript_79843/m.158666 type:complete len:423 (-) Transcript_79843:875-2143(-)